MGNEPEPIDPEDVEEVFSEISTDSADDPSSKGTYDTVDSKKSEKDKQRREKEQKNKKNGRTEKTLEPIQSSFKGGLNNIDKGFKLAEKKLKNNVFKVIAGFSIASLLFFLFFHIVPDRGAVFPKKSPTFANTFIDVDEYIKKYNNANMLVKAKMKKGYIHQELKERGYIYDIKSGENSFSAGQFLKKAINDGDFYQDYKGERVSVTGIVKSIEAEKIEIGPRASESSVSCLFNDPISTENLEKGKKVTVSGIYEGLFELNDCSLK